MRNKHVIGNWKMNTTLQEAKNLLQEMEQSLDGNETVLCVPFTHLSFLSEIAPDTIKLGAQTISEHDAGAFTGEISAKMLKSIGVSYVIVGHSERRAYFHETDELVNLKAKKALESAMIPIICFGETLELRKSKKHLSFIKNQLTESIKGLSKQDLKKSILAYEPVWAIGTGETATPQQAQEVHAFVRSVLADLYDSELAESVTILYGGSVKPNNAASLFSAKDIDGALVGGASLKAADFAEIIKSL